MNPGPFTLRELVAMADGRAREAWNHTSALLAMLANVHRDRKKRPLQPADFHPYTRAKAKGQPWDTAKAFDGSAPVSALCPASHARPDAETRLALTVNGELRQQTALADMVHGVPEILVALSGLFELRPGDLIFTGTPAGVAALQRGDRFHASLDGIAELHGRIV